MMDTRQLSIKERYEIEKELADKLRASSHEERKTLYVSLYDEFNRRVPIYMDKAKKERAIRDDSVAATPQWRFIRRFLHDDTVFLEVGAGTCEFALAVARQVKKVYALEVSQEVTQFVQAPQNFELVLFDGLNIPDPGEQVSVAYSDQVMEHIHPDDAYAQLVGIHRILKPGGIYLCITPNRLNGPHDISKYFDEIATGFHLKEYTNTDLSALMRKAGFSQVRAYIGVPRLYIRVPLSLLKLQEALLERLPRPLCRRIASKTLSWCVRLVGVK